MIGNQLDDGYVQDYNSKDHSFALLTEVADGRAVVVLEQQAPSLMSRAGGRRSN